jgi:hypothetical protein
MTSVVVVGVFTKPMREAKDSVTLNYESHSRWLGAGSCARYALTPSVLNGLGNESDS